MPPERHDVQLKTGCPTEYGCSHLPTGRLRRICLPVPFARDGSPAMQVMISYRVKADQIDRNAELLADVYAELAATRPGGLRYATFRIDDQGSFVAFVEFDGQPGTAAHHRL